MTYAFDTLGYAKKLREAGVSTEQAEAHAEAAQEFVMRELVTRFDLDGTRRELEASIAGVELKLAASIAGVEQKLGGSILSIKQELDAFRREMAIALDRQMLQMTVRLGGMLAIAVAVLATIIKL